MTPIFSIAILRLIFTIRTESLQISNKKEPDKLFGRSFYSTKNESKKKNKSKTTNNISYNPIAKQKWTRKSLGMNKNLSTYLFIYLYSQLRRDSEISKRHTDISRIKNQMNTGKIIGR